MAVVEVAQGENWATVYRGTKEKARQVFLDERRAGTPAVRAPDLGLYVDRRQGPHAANREAARVWRSRADELLAS